MIRQELVYDWRQLSIDLNLIGKELLFETTTEDILKICNGIGPGWFPAWLRRLIDTVNPLLRPVAAIHDLGYYYGDGTFWDFTLWNMAFLLNGCKMACYGYKAKDPRRYHVIFKSLRFALACEIFGWSAYEAAMAE